MLTPLHLFGVYILISPGCRLSPGLLMLLRQIRPSKPTRLWWIVFLPPSTTESEWRYTGSTWCALQTQLVIMGIRIIAYRPTGTGLLMPSMTIYPSINSPVSSWPGIYSPRPTPPRLLPLVTIVCFRPPTRGGFNLGNTLPCTPRTGYETCQKCGWGLPWGVLNAMITNLIHSK